MTVDEVLNAGAPPIMAILRGIRPDEAVAVARALVEAGIRLIEVPFNSPEPTASIAAMNAQFCGEASIGGGTVLSIDMVDRLEAAGGQFMVSPNTNLSVIAHAVARGVEPIPGFLTPTEAFAAVDAGAHKLKLFPGSALGADYLSSLRDVLPTGASLWAVGGVGAHNLAEWRQQKVGGIGIGGALYRPGDDVAIISDRAKALVVAWAQSGH